MSGAANLSPVAPARTVAPAAPAGPRRGAADAAAELQPDEGPGSFAATLERAQAQRKGASAPRPAVATATATAANETPRDIGPGAPATAQDPAAGEPAPARAAAEAAAADEQTDEPAADPDGADLAALLPGWPATHAALPTAATRGAGGNGLAERDIDAAYDATAAALPPGSAAKQPPARSTPNLGSAAEALARRGNAAAGSGSGVGAADRDGAPAAKPAEPAPAPVDRLAAAAPAYPVPVPVLAAQAPPALASVHDHVSTASLPAASTPVPFEARLAAAIDSPAFAPALAHQVSWLVREGVQQARLSLNPAEMGPLTVQIVVDGSQARVDFNAEIAATRQAIEASLPSLAAALHDSGLTLSGGGVFDDRPRHGAGAPVPGNPDAADARPRGRGRDSIAGADGAPPPATPPRAARGLVDLLA